MNAEKIPNCPFCSIEMKVVAENDFKCPKCEREWNYVGTAEGRSLMTKNRRVSVNFSKLHEGGNINEAIKPIAPPAADFRTRSTGEDQDD